MHYKYTTPIHIEVEPTHVDLPIYLAIYCALIVYL
jgi:hypothetical protein